MCLNSTACAAGHRPQETGCQCGGRGGAEEGIHLRPAQFLDVPVLYRLLCELASYENLSHEVASTPALLTEHLFGERRRATALIAAEGTTAAGFAVWYPTFSTFAGRPGAFLEDLYVRPQFRRRGIGRALLIGAAKQAKEDGCSRLEWRALKWNKNALEFYSTLGAEPLAEWITMRLDSTAFVEAASANPLASQVTPIR